MIAQTDAQRQARSRASRKEAGGRSLTIMLTADEAKALDALVEATGWAARDAVGYALKGLRDSLERDISETQHRD